MAIKKTLNVAVMGDLQVEDAYISISQVSIMKRYDSGQASWQVIADVSVHTSRQAKLAGAISIVPASLRTVMPSPPPIDVVAWLYSELKLQPEFSGAVDVFE